MSGAVAPPHIGQASRAARRVVGMAFAALALLLVALLVERSSFLRADDAAVLRIRQAQDVSHRILLLDEQLTMSARLNAASGDPAWRERYERLLPDIYRAIDEASALAQPQTAARFDAATRDANDRLVELEQRAFRSAAAGELGQAGALLVSPEYHHFKDVLADGTARFLDDLQGEAVASRDRVRTRAWAALGALFVALGLALVLLWRRLQAYLQRAETQVAEQHASEQAAAAAVRRKAQVLDGANVGTWTWHCQADVLELNERAAALLCLRATAAGETGARWRARVHPEDRADAQAALQAHWDGRTAAYDFEVRVRDGEGRWCWVHERGRVAERDSQGRPLVMAGIVTDVTERRHATEELRASLALVDSLFQAIPVPLMVCDNDGRIVRLNRAYADLNELPPEQLLGALPPSLLEPGVAAAVTGDDDNLRGEARLTLGAGACTDVLVSQSPIHGADGRPLGLVTALIDITGQKQAARAMGEARDAAESASRAKSAFLATMSHEIRTPMNGVLGMSELLAHSRLDDEQAQTVQTIRQSAGALLRILDDILDFSKIEAGRLDLEDTALDVLALAEDACEALASVARERDVQLLVAADPALVRGLRGDATRLRQIVTNLVGNALKFGAGRAGERGRVDVLLHPRAGSGLRLQVVDHGIGMDADTCARLFQPFMQAEVSTTRRYGGTGLGLAITRRLVELMGGHIGVVSAPGAGSTFTVELPLPTAIAQPADAVPDLTGVEVVLVASRGVPLAPLRAWIEQAGASVQQVEDDFAALHAVQRRAAGVCLVLRQADTVQAALADAGAAGQLLLGRARRAPAGSSAAHALAVDLLRRGTVQDGLALLAGKATPRQPAPVQAPAPADQAGALILVAEDDPVNRAVIARQLALLGHRAEIVADGTAALALWRCGRHALLLTDLDMPGMDGCTLARTIRTEEGEQRLPIVALTANALDSEATRAHAAGMDDYLTKPVPLALLRAALQRWLPALVEH